MSRRTKYFSRFRQAGDTVATLASRIQDNQRASKFNRREKHEVLLPNGDFKDVITTFPASCAISPKKATRLATTILRS